VPEPLQLRFQAVAERTPGIKWQALFKRFRPSYERWFLKEGEAARPGYLTCRRALREHMPELVPMWERLTDLAGGGDRAARLLSLYCPTPYLVACSQVLWPDDEPTIIRNYDYHPDYCEGVLLLSQWNGQRVMASSDSLWGALDGMNEHGLAVTLAFGGRQSVGPGFGMPLILRYVLETCRTVDAAIAVLRRVPSHMAYTLGLLDTSGRWATVFVSPDRPAEVNQARISTNHQDAVDWPEYAALTETEARAAHLEALIARPGMSPDRLVRQFLERPLHNRNWRRAFGTLYTAVYRPGSGEAEYRWPHGAWTQSFRRFVEGEAVVTYQHRASDD